MLRLSVRPSVCLSFVDDVYIVAKRGVLEQKWLLTTSVSCEAVRYAILATAWLLVFVALLRRSCCYSNSNRSVWFQRQTFSCRSLERWNWLTSVWPVSWPIQPASERRLSARRSGWHQKSSNRPLTTPRLTDCFILGVNRFQGWLD